jgi:hypothetical protein
VLVDDLLPRRRQRGRPVRISDSELICLAIAQVLLDCPNERRFLRLAKRRLGHLFPYIPGQSGFNKRLRALAPQLLEAIALLARLSPSFCDRLRLLDSTPVPCAASRETVRRSRLAGVASYGYCRSHHRYFWGFLGQSSSTWAIERQMSSLSEIRTGRPRCRRRGRRSSTST